MSVSVCMSVASLLGHLVAALDVLQLKNSYRETRVLSREEGDWDGQQWRRGTVAGDIETGRAESVLLPYKHFLLFKAWIEVTDILSSGSLHVGSLDYHVTAATAARRRRGGAGKGEGEDEDEGASHSRALATFSRADGATDARIVRCSAVGGEVAMLVPSNEVSSSEGG